MKLEVAHGFPGAGLDFQGAPGREWGEPTPAEVPGTQVDKLKGSERWV